MADQVTSGYARLRVLRLNYVSVAFTLDILRGSDSLIAVFYEQHHELA